MAGERIHDGPRGCAGCEGSLGDPWEQETGMCRSCHTRARRSADGKAAGVTILFAAYIIGLCVLRYQGALSGLQHRLGAFIVLLGVSALLAEGLLRFQSQGSEHTPPKRAER